MGAWGEDTFENDTACDWGYDLEKAKDLSLVERAIDAALDEDQEYPDADVGCEALAACEVLARLKGNFGARDGYTETVDTWVASHPVKPSATLIDRANRAIDRVISPDSELRQLWDEAEDSGWLAKVEDLRRRVRG